MTPEQMVEEELKQDRRVFGNAFWREVDGKKVRIHPQDVIVNRYGAIVSYTTGERVQASEPYEETLMGIAARP